MTTINLDGKWKLFYYPENEMTVDTPEDIQKQGLAAIEATVPGNVELDLLGAGLIPDPYIGNNVYVLREYEKYSWVYSRDFRLPAVPAAGERLEAVFRGVDCIAEYWLNGRKLGSSANALIEQRFNITDFVNAEEENHLVIIIRSPLVQAMNKDYYPSMVSYLDALERLWVRKPAHTYGWDIMPRVFSSGIWRSAFIEVHKENEIEEVFFQTLSANEKTARLKVFFKIRQQSQMLGRLQLKLSGTCGSSTFSATRQLGLNAGNIDINISNPFLWNPRGYGSPHLYEVKAELIKDGEVLQAKDYSVGIRTVELIRTERETVADEGEFLFKINGMPIMCKGTNWVPLDAFHSKDAGRYQEAFQLVLESNCNIVRCWGGNVYEDHEFYGMCDRNGVMVWQEFAMACAAYPLDEVFYEEFQAEARQIIKELRNHPSLIVWCGDNECDLFYYLVGDMDPGKNTITRKVLPEIVFKNDPYRPFINTSPYMTPAMAKVKGMNLKDMNLLTEHHIWAPRDYFKSKAYTEAKANFFGEIGYHGCPNVSSIKRFIEKDHLWPWKGNSQWIAHSGSAPLGLDNEKLNSYTRNNLMADQIREFFGTIPENIEDFVFASQVCQAEAYKYFIESTRIKKWRRTGIIWWNMVDGWPQFSDSVVDYYFGRKLGFHYISRVQERFCIMLDEPDSWKLGIIAGNDSNEDIGGNYVIREADNGSIMAEGDFFVRANENKYLGNLGNERISIGNQKLFLIEWTIDGKTYGNHYLLGYPPFSLAEYRKWLEKISALPVGFDPAAVGK